MKYEKIAECPTELFKAVELANAVSVGDEHFLPDAQNLLEKHIAIEKAAITRENRRIFEINVDEERAEWKAKEFTLEVIKTEIKRFPKLHSYLFEESEIFKNINPSDLIRRTYIIFESYIDFIESRQTLRFVAQGCNFFLNYGEGSSMAFSKFARDFTQPLYFRIIENRIVFVASKIIELLQNIDARRLRICPICRDVFWARRIEARTCPKKRCSNNFHQRKRRIKEYETRINDLSQEIEAEKLKLEKQQNNVVPLEDLVRKQKIIVEKLNDKKEVLTEKIVKEKGINDNL